MERYKTVIVGAGPGGLRCARILAENDEDFILLEGKPGPDRKICTGLWGMSEKTKHMGLPENVFERRFSKVLFSTPHRKVEVRMKNPFVATLNRKRLSEWMHKEAEKAGANIEFGSSVTGICNDYVIANGRKIRFDYLVGADGSSSAVRKSLGLEQDICMGIQYWIEKDLKHPEFHLDYSRFGPWYAWIAPHREATSIGAGTHPTFMPLKMMRRNLTNWCRRMGYDVSEAGFEGAPISNNYKGFRFGNRFLVGDAAGLASGFIGEGIYFAMASGEDIAKIIINKNHDPALIRGVLGIKRVHEMIADLMRLNKITGSALQSTLLSLLGFRYFRKWFIELVT